MPRFFSPVIDAGKKVMVFVDGENLAIRYGNILSKLGQKPAEHIRYEPNIFVWSTALNNICVHGGVLRKYYYTSATRDDAYRIELEERLKDVEIESPHVFKKLNLVAQRELILLWQQICYLMQLEKTLILPY